MTSRSWPLMLRQLSFTVIYTQNFFASKYLAIHFQILPKSFVFWSLSMAYVNQLTNFIYASLLLFTAIGMQHCEVNHANFYGSWSKLPHPSIPLLPNNAPFPAIIPVHVDDRLIICNSLPLYSEILSELKKSLEIIDMGPASLYLGIHITTHDHPCQKLWLLQKSYCIDLLCVWNLHNCTIASTPMILKPHLIDPSPTSLPDVHNNNIKPFFQKLVGSLIYVLGYIHFSQYFLFCHVVGPAQCKSYLLSSSCGKACPSLSCRNFGFCA